MEIIDVLAIITFIVLLCASLFMLLNFYVCDTNNCKAFKQAENIAPRGTKQYTIALLGELCNDGIWPIPYIGAAILTPLSLWFLEIPLTVRNFAILFFVSFAVIYFMFSFFGHHYIKIVSGYTANYIKTSCPDTEIIQNSTDTTRTLPIYEEEIESICHQTTDPLQDNNHIEVDSNNNKSGFRSFADGLDVTFAVPVNIF